MSPVGALERESSHQCAEETSEISLVQKEAGALVARLERVDRKRVHCIHQNPRRLPTGGLLLLR